MSKPLISILIPVYNRAKVLPTTLDSILEQSYLNWECILVDDGSTDNIIDVVNEYIKKDNRFKCFKRPSNLLKGANSCRNYAFSLAKGVYVNWFDSDDIMLPQFLELKLNLLLEDVSLEAVLSRNKYGDATFSKFRTSKFEFETIDSLFKDYALERIEIQTCSFLWKKVFLKELPLFNEKIQRYQDNEFHIRMLALKPKLKVLNKELAVIRSGNSEEDQISAIKNITPKKLFDIFYYRYQCLKLAHDTSVWEDRLYKQIISKKALWTFYGALKKEPSFSNRIKEIKNHKAYLKFIYKMDTFSKLDYLKTNLYLLKLILLR